MSEILKESVLLQGGNLGEVPDRWGQEDQFPIHAIGCYLRLTPTSKISVHACESGASIQIDSVLNHGLVIYGSLDQLRECCNRCLGLIDKIESDLESEAGDASA